MVNEEVVGLSRTTEIFQDSPWSWNLSEKVFLLRTVHSCEIYFFFTNFSQVFTLFRTSWGRYYVPPGILHYAIHVAKILSKHWMVYSHINHKVSCLSSTQLLHSFNSLFSRTTWVSRHQKGKPFWILLEQEMIGWHVAVASAGPYANHLHLAPDR